MCVAPQKAPMSAKPIWVARSFPRTSLQRPALAVSTLGDCGEEQDHGGSDGIRLMHPSIRLGCQKGKRLPFLSEERLPLPA